MSTSVIILSTLALLPAAGMLFYIYKMDRVDKEPIKLLIGLFFLGVGCAIPAILLELLAQSCLNAVFFGYFNADDPLYYASGAQMYIYQILENFLCIALVEEALKWLFMFLITRKNKNFNCLYDGVVYAVFVSLGFAAAENLMYVFMSGWSTALLRMVTAVPAHCFFGVFMGYFYTCWFLKRKAGTLEKHLRDRRIIPAGASSYPSAGLLVLSLAVPTACHGFYDFCATASSLEDVSDVTSVVFLVIFILFLGFLYFICFRNIYKLSKADNYNSYLALDMVLKKYPQAAAYVSTLPEYAPFFRRPVPQPVQQPMQQPMRPPMQQPQSYPQQQGYPQQQQGYPRQQQGYPQQQQGRPPYQNK